MTKTLVFVAVLVLLAALAYKHRAKIMNRVETVAGV